MTGLEQHNLEAASKTAMGLGSGTAIVSGLTLNEIGVIVGIVVGLVGLAAQLYFGITRHRREKELHRKRMSGE